MQGTDGARAFDEALAHLEPLWMEALGGSPRHGEIPELSIKSCLLDVVSRRASSPHIVYRDTVWTFQQTNDIACRIAMALQDLGCEKGQRALVMYDDSPELVFIFMACYKLGLIAVGFDPRSTSTEVARGLEDSGAETAFIASTRISEFQTILRGGTTLGRVVVVDDLGGDLPGEGWMCLSDLIAQGEPREPEVQIAADDPAVIIYTGGTTGVSKGCPLSQRALIQANRLFVDDMAPLLKGPDQLVALSTSPMVHAYGLDLGVNWGVIGGAEVVIADHLDARTVSGLIETYRPSVWGAVPALINDLVNDEGARGADLSSLKVVIMSCAMSAEEVVRRFRGISGASIVEDYGMTETAGPVSLTPVLRQDRPASIGIPARDTDVLVVDLETGTIPLGSGERGEMIFRGPQVMEAYWRAPAETAHVRRGGWLYSGDIGYFDEDGFLYIVDRIKDVIMVGGFSVFPREIDETLYRHPAVRESCTIGVVDARSGERPKSYVVLKPGENASEEELIAYCHEHLIAYKCPRYIEFIDAIPHTRLNKPDRKKLRLMERKRS